MERREFLRTTGLIGACSANLFVAGEPADPQACGIEPREPSTDENARTVLVTSASSGLAQAIAAELDRDHHLRITWRSPVRTEHEFVRCDLASGESTEALVRGVDAIVHVAQPGGNGEEPEQIDNRTRGTYNLLRAAAAQGVRQIVTLSSLCLMTGHEKTFEVDEDWRPLPIVEAGGLSDHLCEFICREFVHEGQLNIIVCASPTSSRHQMGSSGSVADRNSRRWTSRRLARC